LREIFGLDSYASAHPVREDEVIIVKNLAHLRKILGSGNFIELYLWSQKRSMKFKPIQNVIQDTCSAAYFKPILKRSVLS